MVNPLDLGVVPIALKSALFFGLEPRVCQIIEHYHSQVGQKHISEGRHPLDQ